MKNELIELLQKRNVKLDDFNTATLSCVTNIADFETDIEKADKYIEYVELRQKALDEIISINETIESNQELKSIYESESVEILELNNEYNKMYENIKSMQTKMNEIGEDVLVEMRTEFKKIKQKQSFNNAYLESSDTKGSKFDKQQ